MSQNVMAVGVFGLVLLKSYYLLIFPSIEVLVIFLIHETSIIESTLQLRIFLYFECALAVRRFGNFVNTIFWLPVGAAEVQKFALLRKTGC